MSSRRQPTDRRPLSARQQRALTYSANVLHQTSRLAAEAGPLLRWTAEFGPALGVAVDDADDCYRRRGRREVPTAEVWRQLQGAFKRASLSDAPSYDDLVSAVGDLLRLDATERAILQFCADYVLDRGVEELWDQLSQLYGRGGRLNANPALFAMVLARSEGDVRRSLSAASNLRSSGLLLVDRRYNGLRVLERLVRALQEPDASQSPFEALFGKPQRAELALDQFAHMADDIERVRALLEGALARQEAGVHVLLYGPPGTGKTTLSAALAKALEVPLHAVAEEDEDQSEPSRADRLFALGLAQRLLPTAGPAIVLFDEGEDLFVADSDPWSENRPAPSKAFIHRLLERAKLPTIWTANDISTFSPAVLRRFSACVEVKVPPAAVRAELWQKAATAEGVTMDANELGEMARILPAAPALARSAMRAARMAGGDPQTVRWAVSGVLRAMNGGTLPRAEPSETEFDPALIVADIDLAALAEKVTRKGATSRLSFLLSGPPGSGKSAYARWLAGRLDMPVLVKRASGILDKFVGETEKRIAQAFEEAQDTNAFLIFDEADSLIADRRGAVRNWEVSMTNEFLATSDRHPLPFCCTTNFVDHLDEAAMRRFLVKARFDFMGPAQVRAAFRRFFGQEPPPGVDALDALTPSDFDLVRRGAELLGTRDDAGALLEALRREQAAKTGAAGNPIGFRLVA